MKRLVLLVTTLMALSVSAFAQAPCPSNPQAYVLEAPGSAQIAIPPMTGVGASCWYDVTRYGSYGQQLTYSVRNGTLSAVTVVFEGTNDQSAVTSIGTCSTTTGCTITGSSTYAYIRARISAWTKNTGTPYVIPVWAGNLPTVIEAVPNVGYPTPFSQALSAVPSSSTAVTTATVLVGTIVVANITASSATFTVTNTAGTAIISAQSIAANTTITFSFPSGVVMVGLKWSAGTGSALNSTITGWQ